MDFDTVTWVLIALAAGVAFAAGWSVRRVLANGQEAELKRALYDSKGAIPQLEAAVRTRDQRVSNYQTEAEQLRSRISTLETTVSQRDTELVKRDRELRRVNSELSIAKEGGLAESMHPEFQMMEGDSSVQAPPADIDVRLKQAEVRYEALKRGLITRDDRIAALEETLAKSPARSLETEIDALRSAHEDHAAQIASRDATIQALQSRAQEDAEQRAQFETLAKRRTETNRELKDKLFKFEAQLPKLMETLKSRGALIAERDASIKVLQQDLSDMTDERDARDRKIIGLEETIVERDSHIVSHSAELSVRQQRIVSLQQELATTTANLTNTQATLRDREASLASQATKLTTAVAATATLTQDRDQIAESFKNAVRDRDFRIESLTDDVARLTATVGKLTAELEGAARRCRRRQRSSPP
ncbi:MAG: hypothetical protein HC809_00095 [Gammaproteobacteria bacterium]|nr:hypothetical protein [Gammaproteobacteria bacterium]